MSTPGAPADSAPWHRTARRWTVGVLGVGTLALAAYVVVLLLALRLFVGAIAVVTGRPTGGLDMVGVAVDLLPGTLAGWGVGLAALAALRRVEGIGPRSAGLLAGGLGVATGAALLTYSGIL